MPASTTPSPNTDSYSWIGAVGAAWGLSTDWSDTTSSANPAPYVPGSMTPVTIGNGASITGGGSAASITATGTVTLAGSYSDAGALAIGTVSSSSGSPVVTSGTVSLAAGTQLSAASLVFAGGTLSVAGAVVTIGGSISVGTAGSVSPYVTATTGQVLVTAGGTLAVSGSASDPAADLVVSGAGSAITISGTLVAGSGGQYFGASYQIGNLIAASGGFAQLGGVVINGAPAGTAGATNTGISVDGTSTIEIGTAGGAAAGAITVDAGRSIAFNTSGYVSGALVDNGIVAISGAASYSAVPCPAAGPWISAPMRHGSRKALRRPRPRSPFKAPPGRCRSTA